MHQLPRYVQRQRDLGVAVPIGDYEVVKLHACTVASIFAKRKVRVLTKLFTVGRIQTVNQEVTMNYEERELRIIETVIVFLSLVVMLAVSCGWLQ